MGVRWLDEARPDKSLLQTQVRFLPRPLNTGLTVNRRLGFLKVSVVQSQS